MAGALMIPVTHITLGIEMYGTTHVFSNKRQHQFRYLYRYRSSEVDYRPGGELIPELLELLGSKTTEVPVFITMTIYYIILILCNIILYIVLSHQEPPELRGAVCLIGGFRTP